jgi:hypothetical protein
VLPESDRGGLDGEGRDCEGACMSLGVAFAHCPRSHLVDARLRNATGGSMGPMNGIIERCSLQMENLMRDVSKLRFLCSSFCKRIVLTMEHMLRLSW